MNNQKLFGRGVLLAVVAGLFVAGTAQAASYTNIAAGNWDVNGSWQDGATSGKPAAGGAADAIIVFKPTTTDNSTNNNAGAFSLNQLLVVPNQTVNLYSPGGSSLNFTNNAGTLPSIANDGTSNLTINSSITLATNLTVSSASSGYIAIYSNITESAMSDIIKLGTNTLYLWGSNTFSGNIYIKAGTLADKLGAQYGDTANWGPSTATIYLGDATVGAAATLALQDNAGYSAAPASSNPINVVSGGGARTIRVLPGASAQAWLGGNITLSNNLQFIYDGKTTLGNNLKISGNISGAGNLTFASASTIGNCSISLTGASINPVGAITNSSQGTNNISISGAIGANVTAVVQNGATTAPLTLSGTNTYTGPTAILAGSLTLSGSGRLGNGAYAGDITNAGTLVYNSTATQTLSGVISGSGTLTQSRGVLLINNVANTFNGATTVGAGATLGGAGTIAGTVSVASGALLAPSLGTGGSNTLTLSSTDTSALTLNGGPGLKFALSSAGTNDQINVTGGLTLNGANFITLTCPGGALIPQGTYTLMTYASTNGSGTLAFNGTISNATLNVGSTSVTLSVGPGGTSGTLVSGLTWKGNLSGIWDTGTANWTNMAGSASTYADGNAVTFDQNASKFNVTGTVATVSPGSVTFNNATAYTNGANIGGTGYLLKNGSSTATLTGTNTYTGPTLISAGTLTIGGAGQLGNGTYAGAITHNGAGLIFASSAPNTLSGGITGTGTVTKSGSGDLTIAGTNSIGALTLSAGTTSIRDATLTMSGTFTPGGTVNISNATVNLNNQGNLTVAGVANASQNTLNVFSGGIINNTTNLAIGSTANASNAVLSIRGGGLVELNTPAAISVGPGPNNSLTNFGGILQFTTATAPTITVSANNSFVMTNCTLGYRGVTVNITNNWVNSGMGTNTIAWQGNNTLRLNNSTGTNTLGRPYVFDTFHGSTNYANLEMLGTSAIRGGGVTIGTNGSMLVSNGTVNITGTLTNDNGTVTLAGSPAVLMATNTFYNNGLLTGSGTVSGLVTVGSAGTISAGGTGTVGTLTFSTNVVFSSGSTNLWTYNAGGGDTIRILGNISGTCYIKIDGSGDLPANAEVFAFSGTNGTPTFTMLTEGYSRRVTSTNVTVSFSSRGCLMIIK